nr:hypothetical protein [uncultured Rhodopila sp.]
MFKATLRKSAIALAMAAVFAPAVVSAAELTAFDKAELDQLSPALRTQVEARLTSGQTVRGIVETILLNQISQIFASGEVTAIDFEKGMAVWQGPNGDIKVLPFDITTLQLRNT